MKSTKNALISSVLAFVLCCTMLLGSTLAWFTDSAMSADNKIVAGTLDVELWQHTEAGSKNISDSYDPVFSGDILWEPGKTEVVYLSIRNNGSLALKYKVAIEVKQISDHDLTEVMYYYVTPNAQVGDVTSWVGDENALQVNNGLGITEVANDMKLLENGDEHFFALSIHMDDEAGNEYMADSITFDIKVLAGQAAYEEDSFGPNYDEHAGYPGAGFSAPLKENQTGVEVPVAGIDGYKVGSVLIPAEAAADPTQGFEVKINKSTYEGNFTVEAEMTKVVYDVTVSNIKEDNTTPVKAEIRIEAGKDPETVKLYHYDEEIACNYNPYTGYVSFETTGFSPFTVVYDAESEYVAPVVTPEMTRPTATVTYEAQYVGAGKITWGNYGQWSPTEGLDSDLEAAFTFACPTNLDPEVEKAFENWYCDFYVSLDKALGVNQIFLGGNYGSFGWVGFHNGELTLAANEEIGLLEGVTTNPWTYADVRDNVGTFICGVGDVNNALEGATFTVKLRLTNPENEAEYYDVNVVTYTFGGNAVIDGVTYVFTAEALKDAFENGEDGEYALGGNIDLNDLIN